MPENPQLRGCDWIRLCGPCKPGGVALLLLTSPRGAFWNGVSRDGPLRLALSWSWRTGFECHAGEGAEQWCQDLLGTAAGPHGESLES